MNQAHLIELRSHFAKSAAGFKDKGQVHSTMMVIAWVVFANLGLWAQYFKQRKLAVSIHSAFMSIAMIMVWLSGFLALAEYGFTKMSWLHIALGITAILLVGAVEGSGVLCYKVQAATKLKPSLVALINQIHRWGGLLTIFLAILQLLTTYFEHEKGSFIAILIISILSIGGFYFMKFKGKKRAQQSSMTITQDTHAAPLKQIRNAKELSIYKNNYFIFEDKLYDINNVIANHPGGWSVIKAIQGREVDRYLYGTEPLENYSGKGQMVSNNHLGSSIKMAGEPIAKLYNVPPYAHMHDINSAAIQEIYKPCKNSSMYAVYLGSKSNPFLYKGYTSLAQIGKYFTVNIKKDITRLYSCMNCLHLSNLQLMAKLAGGQFWENKKVIYYNNQVQEVQTKQGINDLNLVPLFIKKYGDGAFTKEFLSGTYSGEVKISAPRGRGMFLDELPPGQLLMFAGGTGLNPFADVVDVLFKEMLVSESHPLSQQIVRQCPIASQKLLSTAFQFVLFISVKQMTEIHPLTLYQCNLLAQRNKLRVFLRASDSKNQMGQQYPAINRVADRFDTVLGQWVSNSSQISQIYLCGPPPFCQSIVENFPKYNLEPYKYKIM